jgi:hypothetical protein
VFPRRLASVTVALAIGLGPSVPLAQLDRPADICIAPELTGDLDVVRLADGLLGPDLCIQARAAAASGVALRLTVVRNMQRSGPMWFVPHDEEDAAFVAGVNAVQRYGGTMVAIENGEERLIGQFDPNRIFAATPEAAAQCGVAEPPAAIIDALLNEWDRAYPIVGLHNNWDGFAEAGGKGTISVRRDDAQMIPFPSEVATGRFADEDTVAMLVSLRPPDDNAAGQVAIGWFNDHGVHVIYRYLTDANNGCTLADYLAITGTGPYFNLETEAGDAATQIVLVDRLMAFVASAAYRGAL